MSDDIQMLKQEIAALRQLNLTAFYAYRVLARNLADRRQLDLQQLQAALRHAAESVERNPHTGTPVAFQLNNLADELLYDFYRSQGMDDQQAKNQVGQSRSPEHPWHDPVAD